MPAKYPADLLPNCNNAEMGRKRPFHLATGMSVIAEFALTESYVSLILMALTKGEAAPVAAIYGELRQGHLQSKALLAVAQLALDESELDLLKKIMKLVRSASDARDVLAHRIWLYDDQFPSAVALLDPALSWRMDASISAHGGSGPTTEEHAVQLQMDMKEAIELWSLDDLEHARKTCANAGVGVASFRLMVLAEQHSAARVEERQKVLNVLSLQERLNRRDSAPNGG